MSGSQYAYDSPINISIPIVPSGAPPELFSLFLALHQAVHSLNLGITEYCGLAARPVEQWSQLSLIDTVRSQQLLRLYVPFTDTCSYGSAINLYNNGGVLSARKANATNNTKPCHAVSNVLGGVPSGSHGEVILGGLTAGISGLTMGSRYFLSTTDGIVTNAEPVAAGNIGQVVGFAFSSSLFYFWPSLQWVQH